MTAPRSFAKAEDVFLSLGSNQGDRCRRIRSALRALERLPRTRLAAASSLYLTSAVGPRQRDFVNAAARIRTRLTPLGLLAELKRLEARAGRRPGKRWGPRPLDCDILLFGARRIRKRLLRVPHPRMRGRRFVLIPLSELRPCRLKAHPQNVRLLAPCPAPRSRRRSSPR
ncbi:MAG: 2-amino-4-hydroxy-6-hydroxymethyldihydropteridine diphosphokinase [Elusimicrobiota bacterium]